MMLEKMYHIVAYDRFKIAGLECHECELKGVGQDDINCQNVS